jgi:hypothetical protein
MMKAAAATLFWSQFGRPQPDDESCIRHLTTWSKFKIEAENDENAPKIIPMTLEARGRQKVEELDSLLCRPPIF